MVYQYSHTFFTRCCAGARADSRMRRCGSSPQRGRASTPGRGRDALQRPQNALEYNHICLHF